MTAGEIVEIATTHEGSFPTSVETVRLDVSSSATAPFWVSVDGEHLPHLRDREEFEVARISFEPLDLIGM